MARKLIPVLRISASWTPNPEIAAGMMGAAFAQSPAAGIRFASGRPSLTLAIAAKFDDPAFSARVAAAIAAAKAELERTGTLHQWSVAAGSSAPEDAIHLPDEQTATD